MSDGNKKNRTGELATLERNNYFYGKLLDESSLRMEQGYFNDKRWMMNRLGLGNGVVCGLQVNPQGNNVCISPGVALDALGREIVVPAAVLIDPRKITDDRGVPTGELIENGGDGYVCMSYRECAAEPVPVLVTDCDSINQTAPSIIRESFRVIVKKGNPPPLPQLPDAALCNALKNEDAEATRQAVCEALWSRTCSTEDEHTCVVLAGISFPGGVITVTKCAARPLVYSNPELFEMLLCISKQKGPPGPTGPEGPTGPTGVDAARATPLDCEALPTAAVVEESVGGETKRILELGIPRGCDGAQGSEGAGISKVVVNPLLCKQSPTARLEPDPKHPPHQILTLGIPGHCDQSLTKITDINWKHDGEMKAQDFFSDGLKVTFSAPVAAKNSEAIAESVNGWFQVSAEVWGGEVNRGILFAILANPQLLAWWVASGLSLGSPGSLPVIRVHGAMTLAGDIAAFKPQGMPYDIAPPPNYPAQFYSPSFYMTLYWLSKLFTDAQNITKLQIAIRVTVMTEFLLDEKLRAVDGNHIGGKLPTGDGVQGGNFESWFRLTEIGKLIPPKSAVVGTAVKTRKNKSAKATEAELGVEALASMLPSLVELEKFFKKGG